MRQKQALQKVKDKAVGIVRDETAALARRQQAARFWQMIGGIKVADAVTRSLSSQMLRTLERVKQEKLYKEAGYDTFDQFLDKDPESPMKHDTFLRRAKLLEAEGDEVFDTFNAIGLSFTKRQMLGRGAVEVEGEEIVLREGKEEIRIPLKDRTEVLTAITRLADKNNEQRRTIERGRKDVDKLQRKLTEAAEAKSPGSAERSPFTDARMTAVVALGALGRQARALPPAERERVRIETLSLLSEQWMALHEAFGFETAPQLGLTNLTAGVSDADLDLDELEH